MTAVVCADNVVHQCRVHACLTRVQLTAIIKRAQHGGLVSVVWIQEELLHQHLGSFAVSLCTSLPLAAGVNSLCSLLCVVSIISWLRGNTGRKLLGCEAAR